MAKGRQTVHLPQQKRKHVEKAEKDDDAKSSTSGESEKPDLSVGSFVKALLKTLPVLTLAALVSPVSQQTLAPVFGAIPSSVNHAQAVTATVLLGYIWRAFLKTSQTTSILPYLALFAFWLPGFQHYLFKYSAQLGPVAGPILQGFLSCHTIIIGCAYAVAQKMETLDLQERLGHIAGVAIPAIALDLLYFRPLEHALAHFALPWLHSVTDFFSPVRLQLLIAAGIAAVSPSRPYWLFSLAAPALLYAFLANPHFEGPYNVALVNRDLALHNWTLIDRAWSNTGYLSVLESQAYEYRVLRCDHSLLGGEWLLTNERMTKSGWRVTEPIYHVFQMLEAVRLMEIETPVADSAAQALVVGLGIGTAPKALMAHGINTTIVELDPIVHQYAKQYFGLPSDAASGQVHIQDAITWTSNALSHREHPKYNYILHDVFTGGAEPLSLFTETFISNLRALLTPEGVIAINYAGDLTVPLTARILNTIDTVFSGQCKIFRDAAPPSASAADAEDAQDFLNIAVFCRNSPGPITFRQPVAKDFLGSKTREHYLLPKAERELSFPLRSINLTGEERKEQVLKEGEEGQWKTSQEESAIRHWHIMRKVLPSVVWETW
jgi:hypothetical protein